MTGYPYVRSGGAHAVMGDHGKAAEARPDERGAGDNPGAFAGGGGPFGEGHHHRAGGEGVR